MTTTSEIDELTFEQQQEVDRLGKLAFTPSSNSNKFRFELYAYIESLIAAQQLALLDRLEKEPTIADLFPTHPENNPDSYEDMVSVIRWYKTKFQQERANLSGKGEQE